MSFLTEIKRRKVHHLVAAYAVVGWLLVQIVATVEEPLRLPEWFDTAIIVLLAVGFPIALVLSWFFAVTPQGIVRDDADAAAARPTERQGRGEGRAHSDSDTPGAKGRPLAEIIAAGPLPTPTLMHIAVQIADNLTRMHAKHTVHGFLTPGNVLIGDDEKVTLLDPGRDGDPAAAEAAASRSPEHRRGEPPTFRSDQFALGVLLYAMATGRWVSGSAGEHAEPESVTHLNPQVPMPLQWLIERCLEPDPERRFPRTADLLAELTGIARDVRTAPSSGTTHNLPAQRTSLIGRDKEMTSLRKLITSGDVRFVTLTGAGGIGKTRLLMELGRHALETFRGGVFFVPLDRINDPELVASEVANAVDSSQRLEDRTSAALQRYLRQACIEPTLILIDSFEHLMPAAPLLTELLSGTERLKIVVTSRAALRVYGEHEFHILPLTMLKRDGSSTAETLMQSPAVRLFLDRATWMSKNEAQSGRLEADELLMVAEICERLDGVPLAIELAAARSRILTLSALLGHVREPLKFLAGGPRDLPARQQTLRATLDWSYDLLDEDLQRLFRRLGVFVGGATLEAVEAVCNVKDDLRIDLIGGTEALVESNLLHPMDAEQTRFTMLETMRVYALERLAEAGEDQHTRRAHAAYCLVLGEESTSAGTESQREALYERFELELANLRAAMDWLTATGHVEWGLRLACALGQYWQHRGRAQEGYERISKLLERDDASKETELYAMALAWRGELALHCGNFDLARQHTLESLAISRDLHLVPGILRGLNVLAVAACRGSSIDEAIPYLEEALDVARETGGSPSLVGSVMTNVASFVLRQGDYGRAQRLQENAAKLFEESGDSLALAWSLNHQGDIARKSHDLAHARRLYEEALSRFRSLNERLGVAGTLHDLACVAADAGEHQAADAMNREALALYCALDRKGDIPRVLDALAISATAVGAADQALRLAGCAAATRKACGLKDTTEARLAQSLDTARQQMGSSQAAASWMAGWNMPPEQAVAFALATPDTG